MGVGEEREGGLRERETERDRDTDSTVVVCSLTSIQEARGNVPIIYWSASAP